MPHKFLIYVSVCLAIGLGCTPGNVVERTQKQFWLFSNATSLHAPETQPFLSQFHTVAQNMGVTVDTTLHSYELREESLQQYSALVLFNTPVDSFSIQTQTDIQRYVQAGGSLILINATINTPYTWPWYEQLVTLHDDSQEIVPVYDTKGKRFFSHVAYDGGRIVIPHSKLSEVENAVFTKALIEAFTFSIDDNTYYGNRISHPRAPDDSRFTKVVLDDYDIDEPMELTVLPDGKVLFIERKGKMKLYDPESRQTRLLANFDVCTEGNYEDGLLGVEADPNFKFNNYIYLYYAPPCDISSQYLSRFKMKGTDSLLMDSEKVLLKVDVQRETCCHSGGSITFDDEGNLYLSTGDNTSSKESDGFSPLDERPGRGPFDSQKSSGNTNDLRGKILRITPQPDGTYTIPEGNLFPPDGSAGRPEIYVMGARNPFRISVDSRMGFLYWGDVGPDAASDSKYGPQSYDEFNQARTPGNYGWPYFVGDNKAYRQRDFNTDTVGSFFDPEQVVNLSPNNTGSEVLPPARGAFIWYGKGPSKEFPMLGVGSNSAMAGPIFYQDDYPKRSSVRFPAYYNGKLFIYEWARSWIQVVTMDESGDLVKIEPFLPNMALSKPIDMEFGPDGALYMLEYGQNYFMNNPEAKLVRIEYAKGNRLPVAVIDATPQVGAAPLTVEFSASASFDNDHRDTLTYEWSFPGDKQVLTGKNVVYTFEKLGKYTVSLTVTDSQGGKSTAQTRIQVGNTPPEIDIEYAGNQTFFLDRQSHQYTVHIHDPEDERKGGIDLDRATVNFLYVSEGYDLEVLLGDPHTQLNPSFQYAKGMRLVQNSDCYTCHAVDTASVGPSYREVAQKYNDQYDAIAYLSQKIISGGNGVWGEKIMPGHPQHTEGETQEMAKYIMSLGNEKNESYPLSGIIITNRHAPADEEGAYVLSATYEDKGWKDLPAISKRNMLILRHPKLQAEDYDEGMHLTNRMTGKNRNIAVVQVREDQAYLAFNDIDLTGIRQLRLHLQADQGGTIIPRLDSPDGESLGSMGVGPARKGQEDWKTYDLFIKNTTGKHDLYLVFERDRKGKASLFMIDWIEVKGMDVPQS